MLVLQINVLTALYCACRPLGPLELHIQTSEIVIASWWCILSSIQVYTVTQSLKGLQQLIEQDWTGQVK